MESEEECFVQWLQRVEDGRNSRVSRRNAFIAARRQVFRMALVAGDVFDDIVGVSGVVTESHRRPAV